MRYFERHLEEALKSLPTTKAAFKWITPDDLYDWDKSAIAFIYDPSGELKLGDNTHIDIIDEHIDYYRELDGVYGSMAQLLMANRAGVSLDRDMDPDADYTNGPGPYDIRMQLEHVALLGRVGKIKDIDDLDPENADVRGTVKVVAGPAVVSFWNEKAMLYNNMLEGCLQKLEQENLVSENTMVSMPIWGTVTKDTVGMQDNTKPDKETLRRLKLARELHMMPPDQKKAAQKELLKLGMSFGGAGSGGHKHPWQKAMEKGGYLNPGQKWWAMHSEERNKEH